MHGASCIGSTLQLQTDGVLGKLKELPPTAGMREVHAELAGTQNVFQQLIYSEQASDPDGILAQQKLAGSIHLLQQRYVLLDLQRRLDMELDPDDAAFPEPRTLSEKVQTFFMSRGLVASLNRGTRVLFLLSLLLLVPSLTGIYSVKTAPALGVAVAELSDLRVQLTRQEIEKQKEQLGRPTHELTAEEEQTLDEIASEFENSLAASPVHTNAASIYTLRSTVVRDQVLRNARRVL